MSANNDTTRNKTPSLNHDLERRRRSENPRWRLILDAATETFAEKGYESSTMRDIADKADILAGSLYYYIREKQDLLMALIEDFHDEGRTTIDAVLKSCIDDPLLRLRRVLEAHASINARSITRTAVFYQNFKHLDKDRKQHILDDRRLHEKRLASLIQDAQNTGAIEASIDPMLSALSILTMLNGTHTWYRPERHLPPEEFAEFQADLLLHGLAGKREAARSASPKAPSRSRPKR